MDNGKLIKLLGLPASTGIRTQYFGMQTCHHSANPLCVQLHKRDSLTQMTIRLSLSS
jgi:hypothetical protein